MTSMHQPPKRTFSPSPLAEVVVYENSRILDGCEMFSSFLVEETGKGKELNSYKNGGLYYALDDDGQIKSLIYIDFGWCYKTNSGKSWLLDAAEKPLSCLWNKQNICACLMGASGFLAYVVEALIQCKLLRNDGKVEELAGFNLIKLEECLMELMKNYADSLGTLINNKEHLFNQKYEDSNSIELTSMMAEEIEHEVRLVTGVSKEMNKLTNKLQATPVVLVDPDQRQAKIVNNFLAEPPDSSEAMATAMEAGEFKAVNVKSVVLQSRSSLLASSHPKNISPIEKKTQSGANDYNLSLLIAALLSAITFHTALKIQVCKSEHGYNYNSGLIPICQMVGQHPLFIQLVMAFNSIAFYLSVALMMILLNELPLRPLRLVAAFSMLSAYNCITSDPAKPT